MELLKPARLIPVTGIGSEREAEGRATSVLLAVLSVVRDLSILVFEPMGASKAQTATVETFTEPRFTVKDRNVRPDGLVRITYGRKSWAALVEVKTGTATLTAEQVNTYWDVARAEKLDAVITITNDIAPAPSVHPVDGLRVQSNSPVQVHHLSWTQLLTTAVALKQHKGVSDPEQAWILDELIRYLEHPASGALQFDDMGPNWVSLRSDARDDRLTNKDEGPDDIAQRWDQLLRFIALTLGAEIGEDVQQVIPRKHSKNPKLRHDTLVAMLCDDNRLEGVLRIPNTAGDIDIVCDLRAAKLTASVQLDLPDDRGGKARGTWLGTQLPDAAGDVWIEAYERNGRTATTCSLSSLREDRTALWTKDRPEPARAVINWSREMGQNRRSGGKNPSFAESVKALVEDFYRDVVQTITPWQPKPSRLPDPPVLT